MASRFLLLVVFAAAALAKDAPKSIAVDCAKGESINAALASAAQALIIEFTGVCAEDVVIGRDDVTLRGAVPGAKIAGAAGAPTPQPAIAIRGVDSIALESFAVDDSDRRGIDVRAATNIRLDGIVSSGNAGDGLFLGEGASAFIRHSSFDNNAGDGIGMWQGSLVVLEGTISTSGNARVGLLASGSSDLSVSFFGVQMTSNGNGNCGFFLQFGATAQWGAANPVSVIAGGNTNCGAGVVFESMWAGALTASNSNNCVQLNDASFEGGPAPVSLSGCNSGLRADIDSHVGLTNGTVTGNGVGLHLDGPTAQIRNATITGNTTVDVRLLFGARATFDGTNNVGAVTCDGTVLVRGDVSCPPSAVVSSAWYREAVVEELKALPMDQ
jgi:hypothetical protein